MTFDKSERIETRSIGVVWMTNWPVHATIDGPIVMIGFGSIGKGTLPLIERHFTYDKARIVVIDPDDSDREILDARGIRFIHQAVTRENYRDLLVPLLTAGGGRGFCVNLSVDTSSVEIMELCREIGALYIDTVDRAVAGLLLRSQARTGGAHQLRAARDRAGGAAAQPGGITAVSCCGANPGMVSWFVKQALLDIARDLGVKAPEPKTREEWGRLAMTLGVKGIHIAERDTQRARKPKPRGRVRQHLVGRGLPVGGHAAGRARLGHPREPGCRTTAAPTRPAAAPRSTSCSPAPTRACAPGRRRRGRNTASSSPTTSRSRSPTISPCARAARR